MILNKDPDAPHNLSDHFTLLASHEAESAHLHMCSRNSVLPPMTIRAARVEDCEDLLPILQRAQVKYPDLAQLPEWCTPEENFALARVIEHQDDANCVLVASARGELVGFMVCSSGVDLEGVRSTFDLHPYDNLMTAEEYTAEHDAAMRSLEEQGLEPSEENTQSSMRDLKAENRSSNAFAVSMLCMDEPWHMQAREFLQSAFDAFPEKVQ
ncbi:hypothetical protein BSKO_01397 [Bryopsis sp. KO-2023]|nr:hypothetical protein BSKO_01397 [Bryopsis sp. KO-2023]